MTMSACNRSALLVCSALTAVFCGCSEKELEKTVVRGSVRYAGEPIPHGQIRFVPMEETKGPVSGGVIKDGQYLADGKGGVPLGEHRVEIYAYRPATRTSAAIQTEGGSSEQYLPGKYNGRSELTATITAESSSQSLDFKLEP